MIIEELSTYLYGEHIGALVHFDDDRMLFVFDPSYAEQSDRDALSLAYLDSNGDLIDDARTTLRRAPPFFSNLLPEGHLRSYIATKAGVNESRDYPLLVQLGHDLPGAIEMVVETSISSSSRRSSVTDHPDIPMEPDALRFSLAGVQLKISAIDAPTGGLTIPAQGLGGNWIVKLPSSTYPGLPQNEFSMLRLASMVGIEVPETQLVRVSEIQGIPRDFPERAIAEGEALIVKRFDRTTHDNKVHMEDFAQMFKLYPERKYERYGYVAIGRILATFATEESITQFARRLIFNAMIGNADMHLKNWSVIYKNRKTPELSPAYDLVSTVGYLNDDAMALRFAPGVKKWNELTMTAFQSLASRVGVHEKGLLDPVKVTIDLFQDAWHEEQNHLPLSGHVVTAINEQLRLVPAVTESRALTTS